MNIEFITTDGLNHLKANLTTFMPYYRNKDQESLIYRFREEGWLQDSGIICDDIQLEWIPELDDLNNIITLYTALKDKITTSQAADFRLWVGLAHTVFWDYVIQRSENAVRMPVVFEKATTDQIETCFFYPEGVRRSLQIQRIARLWWAGHLTFDSERPAGKEFELTEILCKDGGRFAGLMTAFFSSNITANRTIRLGVLDSVKKRIDAGGKDMNTGKDLSREDLFTHTNRYLNSMGSASVIDSLSRQQITELCDQRFAKKFGEI